MSTARGRAPAGPATDPPALRGQLRLRVVAECDLTAQDHAAISALLVAAFPEHAATFASSSWYAARPDHRLWLHQPDGAVVAHLDFERRRIGVGDDEVLVAGVGEVAVHPLWRGLGLGAALMERLRGVLRTDLPVDFAYLGCREEVVGFYERVGWHRIRHRVREVDPETGRWTVSEDPTLIMPATEPLDRWPREGLIDLRGMWW